MLFRLVAPQGFVRQQAHRFSIVRLRQFSEVSMSTQSSNAILGASISVEMLHHATLADERLMPSRRPEVFSPHLGSMGFRTVPGQQILLICPVVSTTINDGLDVNLPGLNAPSLDLPASAEGELDQDLPGAPSEDILDIPGSGSRVQVETPPCVSESGKAARLCFGGPRRRARKSQGLFERWWLEYDPKKANYISGKGRGPFGGNSIRKADWPRQMIPIEYKKKWEQREKVRFAFRKHGFEFDVPKWGG